MTDYTEQDVRQLVGECEVILKRLNAGYQQPIAEKALIDCLKPFRADPDEELIGELNVLQGFSKTHFQATERSKHYIAAVREHDAKHGSQS